MDRLNTSEIKLVNGGIAPLLITSARILIPVAVNVAGYCYTRSSEEEDITLEGLSIAAGVGVTSGGLGATAACLSGSTALANIVWMPATTALNVCGNLIAREY